jgi:dihydropteroate synthase
MHLFKNKSQPLLMGILNVTPDSFSDGGRYADKDAAVKHALQMMEEGAAIIDIGGESTRPGAAPVSAEEEIKRVAPVIETLADEAKARGVWLSLATRNAATMRAGLKAGARMINDVSALTHDAESMKVLAAADCAVVLMHMQGDPQSMQKNPHYQDVVREVYEYLAARIAACVAAGISKDRIIADPGIGFGKTAGQSRMLLENTDTFAALGVPVLIGASRKSFLGGKTPEDRLPASLAAALLAASKGAAILRVHDVAETREALKLMHNHSLRHSRVSGNPV